MLVQNHQRKVSMNDSKVFRDKIGFGDYRIIQDREQFSYGIDAVLLADFAARFINESKKCSEEIAVDLGTGTGVIPIILAHKTRLKKIVGLDIEKYFVELAKKSAVENGLDNRISYEVCDVRDCRNLNFSKIIGNCNNEMVDCNRIDCSFVLCNPPYFKANASIASENSIKDVARREIKGCLGDFCSFASKVLKRGGEFYLIHRPERLIDIFEALRDVSMEPRDIRMVSSTMSGEPKFVLVRSIKNAGENLRFMKPLAIYENDGNYTQEILKIYERDF